MPARSALTATHEWLASASTHVQRPTHHLLRRVSIVQLFGRRRPWEMLNCEKPVFDFDWRKSPAVRGSVELALHYFLGSS